MPKSKRAKKKTAACCHCGNTLHTSDGCPLATIDIIDDDLNDKNSSDVTVNDESDERNSKRKREDKGKSVETGPNPSSKGEGSNEKGKKSSAKRQKVTNSESRESSSDFTSEEPEWLKNTQSVTGTSVSIPIEPLNSEVTPQPGSTQSQGTTERIFVTPFYVDLDAYREELREENENDVDDDENENDSYTLYGNARTRIVGVQYYNGIVNKGEAVSLIREPNNPYDKNAIRVDNVMGIQVGHIPKDVAAAIASLIDNGEIKLEATIIGNRGTYSIPLQLHVYGSPHSQESISSSLKKRGVAVESPKQPRQTKKSRAEAAARATFDEAWRDLVGRGQEISMKKKQEAFEKIGISIADLEKLPEAPQPDALLTNLLPYQKQGLGWMFSHEHPEDPTEEKATQFWVMRKVSGSNLYYNVATSYSSQTRPEFSRGGILADDMGLGKTLQTISLIVSDTNGEGFITTPSPTSSDYSKTTLIVAPLSILGNWVDQINTHVKPGALSFYVFHGPNRNSDASFLSSHDVVITTYQVLASSNVKDKRKGLFAIKWRRVVLDEGHIIRTNKTKQSQAACALDAERRWVLSGTPIMNQLNDMYSLVKFLNITPFHDYDLWTRVFSRPVSKGDFDGIDRLSCLIRTTCLRRTKDMKFNGRSILDLPPITSYLHKVKFTPDEKKKYDRMDETAKECFRKLENSGGRGSAAALLEILMRMRQICDHWKLAEERLKLAAESSLDLTPENAQLLAKYLKEAIEDNEDCCICLDPLSSPVITLCRHVFDRECIEQVIDKQKHACPMCRNPIRKEQLIEQPLDSVDADEDSSNSDKGYVSSSKIDALMEFLKVSDERDSTSKSVVFSQWTSFLNLVEPALHHANVKFVRLDGKMSRTKREEAMRMFQYDPEVKVFLISLKCGSLGLNLTAADRCFIMDPWWNPSIEDQAVDRIYRLGQTRPVSIFRFVIENTIEDRVIELQEKKRGMVSQAFGEKVRKDASKRLEARLEDLRSLLETK